MYASFEGEIQNGQIMIPELHGRTKILEEKHLIITVLELNKKKEASGGLVVAGVYNNGVVTESSGKKRDMKDFENRSIYVIVRHALMGRITGEVFDQKYQLGAKLGDVDD